MPEEATHILISFCNTTTGAPSLGLFDIASGIVNVLRVPDELDMHDARGIAVSDRYVFVTTGRSKAKDRGAQQPAGTSFVFVLNRADLGLVTSYRCQTVVDAHSLHLSDDELLVTSTGTDEVVRMTLRESDVMREETLWRPDPAGPRSDVHHLNALGSWQGRLVCSGFGRKVDQLWSSAANGFIVDIETGERLASGIGHPHTLIDVGPTLAYCESSTSTIRLLNTGHVQQVPGYARGLCRIGDRLFAGTSRGRRASNRSETLTNRGDPGQTAGCCSLVELHLQTLAIHRVIDLELVGWEVYDLQPVSGVAGWPIAGDLQWRDSCIHGVRSDFEARDQTVSWLHSEVAIRDAEVTRLHREVAERDRTIEHLHKEVASRDRTVEHLHKEVATRDRIVEELRHSDS